MPLDLRQYLETLTELFPREYVTVTDALRGDWELAAVTSGFEARMRVPVIRYDQVVAANMPVIHNVCASLPRVAKTMDWSVAMLEQRLSEAYDSLLPPAIVESGPIQECIIAADSVDLDWLPSIRYTETENSAYLSAAILVAEDPVSGSLNLSFHRMMKLSKNSLAIYMTPDGHLDRIHQQNSKEGKSTPVVAFIGSHPLWCLGALAAGPLGLDEMEVIGGLLGEGLSVVRSQLHEKLLVPAYAEIALEGEIGAHETASEGPYGEAFGYVSSAEQRPIFTVNLMSHRSEPLFQDIVPAQMEHMTMTGTAIRVHLQKTVVEEYDFIDSLHMPTPMTVYLKLKGDVAELTADRKRVVLKTLLESQRFLKFAVLFDHDVDIDNGKQTVRAMAMHVQADHDLVMVTGQPGNGLDPSERNGKTTKWALDATVGDDGEGRIVKNSLPDDVLSKLDINSIMDRAMKR